MIKSLKQKRFVDFYEGNGTEAAIKAGYSKNTANEQAARLLAKVSIKEAIANRTQKKDAPTIASRQQRQEFWTKVMNDEKEPMANRLRASELLGKSEADFLERYEHIVKAYKYDEFKDKSDEDLVSEFRNLGIGCEN